jgi:hypothetical protein
MDVLNDLKRIISHARSVAVPLLEREGNLLKTRLLAEY